MEVQRWVKKNERLKVFLFVNMNDVASKVQCKKVENNQQLQTNNGILFYLNAGSK